MRDGFFRFYASEVSYFSGKVRPALRYKRVPYAEILATAAALYTVDGAALPGSPPRPRPGGTAGGRRRARRNGL